MTILSFSYFFFIIIITVIATLYCMFKSISKYYGYTTDHRNYILSSAVYVHRTFCRHIVLLRFPRTCDRGKKTLQCVLPTLLCRRVVLHTPCRHLENGNFKYYLLCVHTNVHIANFATLYNCYTHAVYDKIKKNTSLGWLLFQRQLIKIIFFLPFLYYCCAILQWMRPTFFCNPFGQITNSSLILFRTVRLMCSTFS